MGSNTENEEVGFFMFFNTNNLIYQPMDCYTVFDNSTRERFINSNTTTGNRQSVVELASY